MYFLVYLIILQTQVMDYLMQYIIKIHLTVNILKMIGMNCFIIFSI